MAKKISQYTPKSTNFSDTDLFDVSKSFPQTSGALIVGKIYTILDFNAGDNFSNVANVISGTINTTGCVFTATGTTPTTYTNGSTLTYYETLSYTWDELKAGVFGGTRYSANLVQSGDGTSTQTSGVLVVGKRYAITTFVAGDDFSNVATVVSGVINTTGCEFIATGTTPAVYTNGSTLTDTAAPIAFGVINELDPLPIYSFVSDGQYRLISVGSFPDIDKVKIFIGSTFGLSIARAQAGYVDADSIFIQTEIIDFINESMAPSNGQLNYTSILVIVEP